MIIVKAICPNGDAANVAENICKLYANSFATIGKSGGHTEITIEGTTHARVIRTIRGLVKRHGWNVQINIIAE